MSPNKTFDNDFSHFNDSNSFQFNQDQNDSLNFSTNPTQNDTSKDWYNELQKQLEKQLAELHEMSENSFRAPEEMLNQNQMQLDEMNNHFSQCLPNNNYYEIENNSYHSNDFNSSHNFQFQNFDQDDCNLNFSSNHDILQNQDNILNDFMDQNFEYNDEEIMLDKNSNVQDDFSSQQEHNFEILEFEIDEMTREHNFQNDFENLCKNEKVINSTSFDKPEMDYNLIEDEVINYTFENLNCEMEREFIFEEPTNEQVFEIEKKENLNFLNELTISKEVQTNIEIHFEPNLSAQIPPTELDAHVTLIEKDFDDFTFKVVFSDELKVLHNLEDPQNKLFNFEKFLIEYDEFIPKCLDLSRISDPFALNNTKNVETNLIWGKVNICFSFHFVGLTFLFATNHLQFFNLLMLILSILRFILTFDFLILNFKKRHKNGRFSFFLFSINVLS